MLAGENLSGYRIIAGKFPAGPEAQRAPCQTQNHFSSKRIGTVKAN